MLNLHILFTIFSVCLVSAFPYGYHMGITNVLSRIMQQWVSHVRPHEDENDTLLWSVVVAMFPAGCALGSLFTNSSLGYQKILFYSGFLTIISQVLLNLCIEANSLVLLIVGRFLIGISTGVSSVAAPIYLAEIASEYSRAKVVTCYQIFVTFSMWLSQLLGLGKTRGIHYEWVVPVMVGTVPPMLGLILIKFCPESPRHVLITEEDERRAFANLSWLRRSSEIGTEFQDILKGRDIIKLRKQVTLRDIFHMPFLVCSMVVLSEQLCGTSIIIYHSSEIFLRAGFKDNAAYSATVLVGAAMLFGTFIFFFLVDWIGRKMMYLVSMASLFLFTILATVALLLSVNDVSRDSMKYMAFAGISFFGLMYGTGVGPARWLIIVEPFNYTARPLVASLVLFFNFALSASFAQTFLLMEETVRYYIFTPFIILDVVFFLFALFFLEGSFPNAEDDD